MEIPAELRRIPPAGTLEWVAATVGSGARVTGVRRLHNASAAAVHAVDVEARNGSRHELVLRRWARTDLAPDPGVVENEATVLRLVARATAVPTPELVAADPDGSVADAPALVMTRLPGRDELTPLDMGAFLDGLVAALHAVHAVAVPAQALDAYRPWGLDDLNEPPPWAQRPDVWRRAFEIARRMVPDYTPVLCHRDFHPGNVLWLHGHVTGVVDWTHTCAGPASADVAHCRANLALLFGLDVADDFARRYGPVPDLAWFDVIDVVGWRTLEAWRWHDAGRFDITDETIIRSADAFLADAVERFSRDFG